MSWKKTYIKWYKIAEDVLAGSIPFLNEDEVPIIGIMNEKANFYQFLHDEYYNEGYILNFRRC